MAKTLQVKLVPDQYRGDLDCVKIISKHSLVNHRIKDLNGYEETAEIIVDGEKAGEYTEFRNNARAKLSASKVVPAEGWKLEWVGDETEYDLVNYERRI